MMCLRIAEGQHRVAGDGQAQGLPCSGPLSQRRDCCRAALLKLEEDYIERQCAEIAKHKPDLVVTEKGLSDLAMHFLTKAGISAIRRLRKTDNNRIARATGATIVHRYVLSVHVTADC